MGLFDIIKAIAGVALGSEKVAKTLTNAYIKHKFKKGGHTDVEINEVLKAVDGNDKNLINQDVMLSEALKKNGYTPAQIDEIKAKLKFGNENLDEYKTIANNTLNKIEKDKR